MAMRPKRLKALQDKIALFPTVKVGKTNHDVTGIRFGHLVAIEKTDPNARTGYSTYWRCQCDCGQLTDKLCSNLIKNNTTSCGCVKGSTKGKIGHVKHGISRTKIYQIWNIIVRPHQKQPFEQSWKDDIEKFITDVGRPPSYRHSLRRIDLRLGFFKDNLHWVYSDKITQTQVDRWTKADEVAAVVLQDIEKYQGRKPRKKSTIIVTSNLNSATFIGRQYGKLKVVSQTGVNAHTLRVWKCQCECGNVVEKTTSYLTKSKIPSCGCASSELRTIYEDLTGEVYSKLTVLSLAGKRKIRKTGSMTMWNCRCECGKEVVVSRTSLVTAGTQSCGCAQVEACTIHSESYSVEYSTYRGMMQRCHNPNNMFYKQNQLAGIEVSPRWRESVLNFIEDMGRRPEGCIALARRSNSKGFNKENCFWREPSKKNKYRKNPKQPPKFDQVAFKDDVGIVRAGSTRPNATESNGP